MDTVTETFTIKKGKKTIEQELGCKLIKLDPDKEDFDIYETLLSILLKKYCPIISNV